MKKKILIAIGGQLLIISSILTLAYLGFKYEWLQDIYMGIFLIVLLVAFIFGRDVDSESFTTYTGPKGGEYRMSSSGKSKIYITKS